MMSDSRVRMDDNRLYLVWLFREFGMLSNVLYAIAHYKSVMGGLWPSSIVLHAHSRMTFGIGEDTVVTRRDGGVLISALYLSTFAPKLDRGDGTRTPTLAVERKPMGRRFRDRRTVDDRANPHRGPVE